MQKRIREEHYYRWSNIKSRCYKKTDKKYHVYGARGITMFPAWIDDFKAFQIFIFEALGPKPSEKHTLDRIDNNGNYEPGNLRWATPSEQNKNKGSSGYKSRLTAEMVEQIKTSNEPIEALATRFGISPAYAGNIRAGRKNPKNF